MQLLFKHESLRSFFATFPSTASSFNCRTLHWKMSFILHTTLYAVFSSFPLRLYEYQPPKALVKWMLISKYPVDMKQDNNIKIPWSSEDLHYVKWIPIDQMCFCICTEIWEQYDYNTENNDWIVCEFWRCHLGRLCLYHHSVGSWYKGSLILAYIEQIFSVGDDHLMRPNRPIGSRLSQVKMLLAESCTPVCQGMLLFAVEITKPFHTAFSSSHSLVAVWFHF